MFYFFYLARSAVCYLSRTSHRATARLQSGHSFWWIFHSTLNPSHTVSDRVSICVCYIQASVHPIHTKSSGEKSVVSTKLLGISFLPLRFSWVTFPARSARHPPSKTDKEAAWKSWHEVTVPIYKSEPQWIWPAPLSLSMEEADRDRRGREVHGGNLCVCVCVCVCLSVCLSVYLSMHLFVCVCLFPASKESSWLMMEVQKSGRQWPSNCLQHLRLALPPVPTPSPSILPMRCPFSLSLCLCKAGQVFVTGNRGGRMELWVESSLKLAGYFS